MSVTSGADQNVTSEPISAFSVYSEQLRKKKKPKVNGTTGGVSKTKKKVKLTDLKVEQMREIGMILQRLSENSHSNNDHVNGNINSFNVSDNSKDISKLSMFNIKSIARNQTLEKRLDNEDVSKPNINTKTSNTLKKSNSLLTLKSPDKKPPAKTSGLIEKYREMNRNSKKLKLNKTKTSTKNISTTPKINNKFKKTINYDTESISLHHQININGKSSNKNNQEEGGKNKLPSRLNKMRHRSIMPNNHLPQDISKKSQVPKTATRRKKVNNMVVSNVKHHNFEVKDNKSTGLETFKWLILPVPEKEFAEKFWERQPLLIQRKENQDYYSELLSTSGIDEMLRENVIHFTKHLDVTSYCDGVRETHNLTGRAHANVVWDFYANGCSIRLLNPQAFFPEIHSLNATLQEYFGCFVGANVYLTPPNSQGFAPHYDDIEAFVLQIEGKKHWRLYPPRNDAEVLARFSSPNFRQDEIGKPCLDVILEPGDILYFPRGFIHQAYTVDNCHSLHITLSAYQKTAWVDLFEKALPLALQKAVEEDVEFRRGLPRDYLSIQHSGGDAAKLFKDKAKGLLDRLAPHFLRTLNASVDKMGAQFMHDALPPILSSEEKENSVSRGGLTMGENGALENMVDFQPSSKVKLIRANVCRLVKEEGETRLYHCLDNSLEYHAEDPQFLVMPAGGEKVIKSLARAYPAFITVSRLPHSDIDDLLALVSDLWDAGLLLARGLSSASDD